MGAIDSYKPMHAKPWTQRVCSSEVYYDNIINDAGNWFNVLLVNTPNNDPS